jgi:predicted nucleic acid-binding protein
MEAAVLDASVLFRGAIRDFLLWLAEAGAFSPVWSDMIHDEWMRNRQIKFGTPIFRLEWARSEMERAFPGANFAPDAMILKSLELPDPGDVHVVATAVAADARVIITYNERDFPRKALEPFGLRAETPDLFCIRLESLRLVSEGARLHRASLKNPPYDLNAYLAHLERQGLEQTATILRASPHPI